MSNPIFRSGPLTFEAAEKVEKFRLVQLTDAGVKHADSSSAVFGAVSESAEPSTPNEAGDLTRGLPSSVAVHSAPATVLVETSEAFETGAEVHVAADGKAAAAGGAVVGYAVRKTTGGSVKVRLTTPVAAS